VFKSFLNGDNVKYDALKESAMKLGSAFQKVNFLRDLKHDYESLGRIYFPNIDLKSLTNEDKLKLVSEIELDFKNALKGIVLLPKEAKFGVYTAYKYYLRLLHKISKTESNEILNKRIRVGDFHKIFIVGKSYVRYQLNVMI